LEFAGFARLGKRTEGALRGEEKRDLCLCLIKCKPWPLWALLVTQKSRIFKLHLGELKEIAKEEKSGRSNLYL